MQMNLVAVPIVKFSPTSEFKVSPVPIGEFKVFLRINRQRRWKLDRNKKARQPRQPRQTLKILKMDEEEDEW